MGWMSKRIWTATFLLLLGAGVCFVVIVQGQQQSIPMPDESLVELTVEHEGTTYKLVNGDLYRVASPDRLVFVEKIYDKDFREKNYTRTTDRSSGGYGYRQTVSDSAALRGRL